MTVTWKNILFSSYVGIHGLPTRFTHLRHLHHRHGDRIAVEAPLHLALPRILVHHTVSSSFITAIAHDSFWIFVTEDPIRRIGAVGELHHEDGHQGMGVLGITTPPTFFLAALVNTLAADQMGSWEEWILLANSKKIAKGC